MERHPAGGFYFLSAGAYTERMRSRRSIVAVPIALIAALAYLSCAGVFEKRIESPETRDGIAVFRLRMASARTVQVAGDWPGNNWARGDAESGEVLVGLMRGPGDDGVWELDVALAPGRHRYRFLVNESLWMLDPGNPRVVDDGRGGKANLIVMP